MGDVSMWAPLLTQLASTGVVGIFLVIALFALRHKDKALEDEKNARIKDAHDYTSLAMTLQKDVILAVKTLGEIVEKWEKREEERERFEREITMRTQGTPMKEVPPHGPRPPPFKR